MKAMVRLVSVCGLLALCATVSGCVVRPWGWGHGGYGHRSDDGGYSERSDDHHSRGGYYRDEGRRGRY